MSLRKRKVQFEDQKAQFNLPGYNVGGIGIGHKHDLYVVAQDCANCAACQFTRFKSGAFNLFQGMVTYE